jgi:hypothetical protein
MLSSWQLLVVFLLSLNLQEVLGNPEDNEMIFTLLHKGKAQNNRLSFPQNFCFPIIFFYSNQDNPFFFAWN